MDGCPDTGEPCFKQWQTKMVLIVSVLSRLSVRLWQCAFVLSECHLAPSWPYGNRVPDPEDTEVRSIVWKKNVDDTYYHASIEEKDLGR